MKIKLLVLAIASLFVFGCKESSLNKPRQEPSSLRKGEPQTKQINPFEFMGQRHNELLEAGWAYVQKSGDTTHMGMRKFILVHFREKSGIDFTKQLDLMVQRRKEMGSLDTYIERSWLSDQAKDLVRMIFDLSEKMEDAGFPFESEMLAVEEKIMASEMPDRDREALLQLSSIARYSGLFWKGKYQVAQVKANSGSRSFFGSIIRVVAPSHADILSGLIGIICGDSINDIIHYASSDSMYMAYYVSGL